MPFVAPKMAVSQFKSEEEFCRDSENGRKTLPRFESGRGDLHAHRVSRKNLDYVCCRSSFGLPRGTTCFPKQQVVARNRKENLATRQKAASICTCGDKLTFRKRQTYLQSAVNAVPTTLRLKPH